MTAVASEIQMKATIDLVERKRIARSIALGSGSFTALIAIVATILAIVA